MGIMKLSGMTLKGLFSKPATRKYPVETREPFARTRGQIDMIDVHECIFCGMCARQCPADAIEVDRGASKWTYYPYKCIACDSCVRKCPKHVLVMKQERPAVAVDVNVSVEHALTAAEIAENKRAAEEKKAQALKAREAAQAAKQD